MVAITLFFFLRRSQNTHTIEDLCFSYFQSLLLLCGTISIGKWRSIGLKNDRFLFILFIIIIIIIWIIGHSRTVACADTNQPHFLPIYSRHTTRRTIYYNRWLMSIVVCEHLGTYQKTTNCEDDQRKFFPLCLCYLNCLHQTQTHFSLSLHLSLPYSLTHSFIQFQCLMTQWENNICWNIHFPSFFLTSNNHLFVFKFKFSNSNVIYKLERKRDVLLKWPFQLLCVNWNVYTASYVLILIIQKDLQS